MKNFLITVGIIAVGYLAVCDTLERFKELDKIAVTTPAQIEMKSDITKSNGNGVKTKINTNNTKKKQPSNKEDLTRKETKRINNQSDNPLPIHN